MRTSYSSRVALALLAGICALTATGCATPPPVSQVAVPEATPSGVEGTSLVPQDEWDPLRGIDPARIPEWVKEMFPLPTARQITTPSLEDGQFVGEWETAESSIDAAGVLATRLIRTGWQEIEKESSPERLSTRLVSPGNDTEIWFLAQSFSGVNRLKVEIKVIPKSAA